MGPPAQHRACVRVLPIDAAGQVLLLRSDDPGRPDGHVWSGVGGAVEPGESLRAAAARALREQTGLAAEVASLRGPVGRQEVELDEAGDRVLQDRSFYAVPLDGAGPRHGGAAGDAAWWSPDALEADGGADDDHLPTLVRIAVSVARGAVPRVTARVMPVDDTGRVLLLRRRHPAEPQREMWGSVGGEVGPGETLVAAALRELAEETGVVAREGDLTGVVHRGAHRHERDGVVHHRHSTVYALPVGAATSVRVSLAGLEPDEVGSVRGAGWWTPEQMARAGLGTHADLPDIMAAAVAAVRPPLTSERGPDT